MNIIQKIKRDVIKDLKIDKCKTLPLIYNESGKIKMDNLECVFTLSTIEKYIASDTNVVVSYKTQITHIHGKYEVILYGIDKFGSWKRDNITILYIELYKCLKDKIIDIEKLNHIKSYIKSTDPELHETAKQITNAYRIKRLKNDYNRKNKKRPVKGDKSK